MSTTIKSLLEILETQKRALDQFKGSLNRLALKAIFDHPQLYQDQLITVGGWVKTIRQKFIHLNDGSGLETLQLVCPPNLANQLKAIKFGSYLTAYGKLALTPNREQSCELKVTEFTFLSSPTSTYPLQKQKMTLETIRHYPHLRTKTTHFLAVFGLRHAISKSIHQFFDQAGFYQVPTPLITASDTEGAGELFNLSTNFFPKPAKLTVSGQLHAEALVQGLGKVYTFSPCFRAEKSHTTRHLAEFWMVEAELAPTDLTALIRLTERLIKFIISSVLEKQSGELKYLEKYSQKAIISKLEKVIQTEFIQLEYTSAIKILQRKFGEIKCGMDLKAEHEKYLCHYSGDQPIFITGYPSSLKAFYMSDRTDKKTVDCFDLIFPEIGELVGGSMRESNYQTLKTKAEKRGIDLSNLAWYLDLRQSGYAPSGGFGLGLERLIMFLGGIENIQDTIAFPILHKHLQF